MYGGRAQRVARCAKTLALVLTVFKESIIVVLRKSQKPDYLKLGLYRPITLLNTLVKTLKAIVAKRISREAEAGGLLLKMQIGAQLGRSTTSVFDLIIKQVKIIWKTSLGEVASMLCLEISRAFDNMSY